MNILKNLYWLILLSLILSGCRADDTYNYSFDTGGYGGKGWPIWVEKLVFNETWGVPVGALSGGVSDTSKRLPGGKAAGAGYVPLPQTIRARWFSYRTQTFYEATLEISEEKGAQIKDWFERYPTESGFSHALVSGISGEGSMQVWWSVICVNSRGGCTKHDSYEFELAPRIQATVAEGDARIHSAGTEQEVEMGNLPPEVLDLIPPGS
ncbi:DUF2931 family protein [Gynuella sunshinyii]|uniref:DUF2931 family protein n=1 Tax=Gynuella sunshinyii YC6258 TaxID=1445510 RepID=A0A0C5W1S9_9GAMM|nr:DUF2931 family protein [Gynuella sunshinyii]AJQ96634.1 hypothetical Protein YC6258_04602 [Gynuella sunshinyii YC6258]